MDTAIQLYLDSVDAVAPVALDRTNAKDEALQYLSTEMLNALYHLPENN